MENVKWFWNRMVWAGTGREGDRFSQHSGGAVDEKQQQQQRQTTTTPDTMTTERTTRTSTTTEQRLSVPGCEESFGERRTDAPPLNNSRLSLSLDIARELGDYDIEAANLQRLITLCSDPYRAAQDRLCLQRTLKSEMLDCFNSLLTEYLVSGAEENGRRLARRMSGLVKTIPGIRYLPNDLLWALNMMIYTFGDDEEALDALQVACDYHDRLPQLLQDRVNKTMNVAKTVAWDINPEDLADLPPLPPSRGTFAETASRGSMSDADSGAATPRPATSRPTSRPTSAVTVNHPRLSREGGETSSLRGSRYWDGDIVLQRTRNGSTGQLTNAARASTNEPLVSSPLRPRSPGAQGRLSRDDLRSSSASRVSMSTTYHTASPRSSAASAVHVSLRLAAADSTTKTEPAAPGGAGVPSSHFASIFREDLGSEPEGSTGSGTRLFHTPKRVSWSGGGAVARRSTSSHAQLQRISSPGPFEGPWVTGGEQQAERAMTPTKATQGARSSRTPLGALPNQPPRVLLPTGYQKPGHGHERRESQQSLARIPSGREVNQRGEEEDPDQLSTSRPATAGAMSSSPPVLELPELEWDDSFAPLECVFPAQEPQPTWWDGSGKAAGAGGQGPLIDSVEVDSSSQTSSEGASRGASGHGTVVRGSRVEDDDVFSPSRTEGGVEASQYQQPYARGMLAQA